MKLVLALTLGIALAFAAAIPALAGDTNARVPDGTLAPPDIVKKLEANGYTKVHDVEYDDGKYEAEAVSPGGVAVDLELDPVSGEVIKEQKD